ncbi:MAG: endonuclease [Clostridia bacterium]|nr:endonuclease [Clostridia bacterium]
MNRFLKLLTLFLVLIMLVQSTVVSVFAFTPLDVETNIYQAAGQPSKYSSQYNSGQRDVIATTLNGTSADAYYSGSYEYDVLSEKSANEIKNALATLMKSTHTYISSYDDCHSKANRTDCENEEGSSNKLSLIYTSYTATMSQWNGWNREHVWPKSLGGNNTTGGGADLHHIRPSDASVNSSRGNKKYGDSNNGTAKYGSNPASGYLGGYYNSTYFEPLDNVKGDVARICLYVWIRWGSSWGADSVTEVFQSVDVLLEWMLLDPVDTWELGRNEVIEDIQGNRNVFIDYPEYAWLVFGREIPDELVSPSGEASGGGCDHVGGSSATCTTAQVCTKCGKTMVEALGHNWNNGEVTTPAGCTTNGVKTITCTRCSATKTTIIAATGHSFGSWITDKDATPTEDGSKHRDCSLCGYTETVIIYYDHTHSYTSVVTKPTCSSQGYTTHTCDCGDSYIDSYTNSVDHTYANGLCTVCGAKEPTTPLGTKDDFSNIVIELDQGIVLGETRYQKICEAINIYNSLSQADKDSLNEQYAKLKSYASEYNEEAINANEESVAINNILISISVSAAVVSFVALTLLKKKVF